MCQGFLNKKNNFNYSVSKGYTLLEVLISIVFFAIITVGLSLPISSSISLTVDNKNINAANNLARSYLEDVEAKWTIQSNFDAGTLIAVTDVYTNNKKYNVTVTSENISTDNNGVVIVRRINIKYKNTKGKLLTDIYYDYDRPGNV
ncbi:MAG: hypothetical protein WCG23_02785 [bacterium]